MHPLAGVLGQPRTRVVDDVELEVVVEVLVVDARVEDVLVEDDVEVLVEDEVEVLVDVVEVLVEVELLVEVVVATAIVLVVVVELVLVVTCPDVDVDDVVVVVVVVVGHETPQQERKRSWESVAAGTMAPVRTGIEVRQVRALIAVAVSLPLTVRPVLAVR